MRPSARGDGGLTTRARATTARERSQGAKAQLPKELSWIPDLVHGAFFAPCDVHSTGSKGEQVNLFSLSSRRSMCPACAAERDVFDTIQVRRATRAILFQASGPRRGRRRRGAARVRTTRLGALNRAKCGKSSRPQLSFARRVRAEATYD